MNKLHKNIVLQAHDLCVGYTQGKKRIEILTNINVSLQAGELICFMGPNGAGKSTLLRTISGVQPLLNGNVEVMGKTITDLSLQELAVTISMVLTDKTNSGNLTVRQIVALGRYPYLGWNLSFKDEDQNKINSAMTMTNINALANKKIHELSDGQMQKVMIARALCQDTPIMILDEPTAHLDLNNRVEIINLLKRLSRSTGKAILMATHELDLALQSADRLWLVGHGTPIEEGFPEDMVLNGKIDKVFQLKGYDLKTGHLHKTSLGKKISLKGEGYLYLWTKNALERNGFEIDTTSKLLIEISTELSKIEWTLSKNDSYFTAYTLEQLINHLLEVNLD